jgi:hypothetical protein
MLGTILAIVIGVPFQVVAAVLVILTVLLIVPTPLRQPLRNIVKIRARNLKAQITTPIERELELIAGPQKVIDESHAQVEDLRGSLLHERNVLMLRQDDQSAAEAQYYAAADDRTDSGIDELVQLVAEKEQEVSIQQGVVDGIQTAVGAACAGVDKARKDLRRVQMTVKSDEAKAKATVALDAAAKVMEAARSISADGGALKQASGEVNHEFEKARARIDIMQGSASERELKQITDRDEIAGLRQRLDSKRAAKAAPAQAVPATPAAPAKSQS